MESYISLSNRGGGGEKQGGEVQTRGQKWSSGGYGVYGSRSPNSF